MMASLYEDCTCRYWRNWPTREATVSKSTSRQRSSALHPTQNTTGGENGNKVKTYNDGFQSALLFADSHNVGLNGKVYQTLGYPGLSMGRYLETLRQLVGQLQFPSPKFQINVPNCSR
jgi:hypothetical protein